MTAYEIITVILGIVTLMIAFAMFIIALLSYIEREDKHKK